MDHIYPIDLPRIAEHLTRQGFCAITKDLDMCFVEEGNEYYFQDYGDTQRTSISYPGMLDAINAYNNKSIKWS